MDPGEIDALVKRLVANPHDEEALAYAHRAGAADPKGYAYLLEKVGHETRDSAYASHWLSEAANVWSTTLGDAHHAAHLLKMAVDKDPTQQTAASRLAQLYRDKGDVRALIALLAHRARALAPLLSTKTELVSEVAGLHEELGRLWSEPPLSQPKKAIENYRRAIELDPQSAFAIYSVREIYKAENRWDDAFQMYEMELSLEQDPARRLALLRDEGASRRAAGDLPGATRALALARQLDAEDPILQQELAATVLDRIAAAEPVPDGERKLARDLLVGLAETYDGEHGLAYAAGALDIDPGHERAMQLYAHYARTLSREEELPGRFHAYLGANPNGAMAQEARQLLGPDFVPAPAAARDAGDHAAPSTEAGDVRAPRPNVSTTAGATETMASPFSGTSASRRISGGPMPPDRMQGVLDAAQMLAGKGKKPEALAKYKEILETDAAHPEALSWVEDYLRTKRDYAQLRDVLLASTRALSGAEAIDARRERLREVAGLCEGNLRDTEGAISAWKQLLTIDRADEAARQALTRLLEKTARWDELANLYEQEATLESDIETKIQLEKKLANLQETKRKDFSAAAEAWGRIAHMTPDDERALSTASKLFEKAGKLDQAAQVLADHAANVDDAVARGALLERLGELREQLNDIGGAGDAYADAAEAQRSIKLWEIAERCFVTAERWEAAANAAGQRGSLANDSKQQAQSLARAADHLVRVGDEEGALARLEQATDLDPAADEFANALGDRYLAAERWEKLAQFLAKRGDRLTDRPKRVAMRRQAAQLYFSKLSDKEAAREQWLKVLEDGDDREALEKLIDDAVEREDHTEAATLLRRLGGIAVDKADKARVALREAELLAEGVGDVDTAIARYEGILADLDPTCRPALQAIADLQEARDNHAAAADALERELKLVADVQERGQIAARLARLYEQHLDDPKSAIRALDIVRKADLDDFDALTRLCELCEKVEQWDRVAELLAQRIEVEGDEEDASIMTKKLAEILADKLDRGDEALAALTELADQGDAPIREAYVELGDRLGWKGIVAGKLVEWWFEAKHSPERTAALRGAFDRFCVVGRDQEAGRVAIEIIRSKGADPELSHKLEELAVKTGDHDALSIAHDLISHDLSGAERATELVRQAELRVKAGMPRGEAVQHGESGLTSVPAAEVEPLLERLAQLTSKSSEIIDLYERQVSRCKAPTDRVRALARVAQVAVAKGQLDRARAFFDLALAGATTEDVLTVLEEAASTGDRVTGGEKLRRTLCAAMAAGGQGARDGGRTRGSLLRRAAALSHNELHDIEQAFVWLGDALIAHVEPQSLDELVALAKKLGAPKRAEETLTRALSEVFDGPLVRQLLARRATLRRELLDDKQGAAGDLKKLHDLSPTDQSVMDELSALLTELGDYRGMVQLYEDQILRGKDMLARSELARKVARMWEEQLQDPREAADAWRRVLRMKTGDTEATAGLERAKSNMLKKPDPLATDAYAPPKLMSAPPPVLTPPPVTATPSTLKSEPPPSRKATLESPALFDRTYPSPEPTLTEAAPPSRSPASRPRGAIEEPRGFLRTNRVDDDHTGPYADEDLAKTIDTPLTGYDAPQTTSDVTKPPRSQRGGAAFVTNSEVTRSSPLPSQRMSSKPPPLPPVVPMSTAMSDQTDLQTAVSGPPFDKSLSSTDESSGLLDFPDETAIGRTPHFSSSPPPVKPEEDVLIADDIAEAIEGDDDDDAQPKTEEQEVPPTRSVPSRGRRR
jgi:tetratricopeptide (TPR) repeat protein